MLSDFRLAFRALAKSPGFTITALLVLTLGIGLNTAMFSVIHAMSFSSRPFPDAEQVVQLYAHERKDPTAWQSFSYDTFRELRAREDLFSGLLAQNITRVGYGEGDITRRAFSAIVSSNYFNVLGVQPMQGRSFTPSEEAPGAEAPVVIVSYPFWKKSDFDSNMIGSTLRINERAFTVIGIMPEGFSGTMMLIGTEFYFPLGVMESLSNDLGATSGRTHEQTSTPNLMLVARLQNGLSMATINSALDAQAQHMEEANPVLLKDQAFLAGELPRLGAANQPHNETAMRIFSLVLLGLTAAVLLLVCLNLAGLMMARGYSRKREIAIRLALGSGRGRIIRQLITEGFMLSLFGGLFGFIAAMWASDLVMSILDQMLPVPLYFGGTATFIGMLATMGFVALATVMFALGPALRLSRTDVLSDLKQLTAEATVQKRSRWLPRHPLVVAQIAVSMALLIAAGLFIRMAHVATHTESGLDTDPTLIAELDARLGGYDEVQSLNAYGQIEQKLEAMPGVESVSLAASAPHGILHYGRWVRRAGLNLAPDATPSTPEEGKIIAADWNAVGSSYFSTVGIPILRGRAFSQVEAMSRDAPPVVVIDEALARKIWPEGNAIGQFIQFPEDEGNPMIEMEIVGIAKTTRTDMFDQDPRGSAYVPFARGGMSNIFLHVRSSNRSPEAVLALLEPMRQSIAASGPSVPVLKVQTFLQHRDSSVEFWAMRLIATLFLLFGLLALMIAVIGIYGIKAYTVSRRTKEIGIRMALGAQTSQVRQLFLREGMQQMSVGLIAGTVLAVGLSIVLDSIMVDMAVYDPIAYIGAGISLGAATMFACWLPARKAALVDPNIALRAE